jgi:hyperosmotically inducible protein
MRTIHRLALPAALLGLAVAVSPGEVVAQEPGSDDRGAVERAGEQVDRFLDRLQKNFKDLSEDVRQRTAQVQQRVENLGVEARVYSRIRWDKALSESEIAVEAKEGGLLVLHGTVKDAELKRKAVRLAVETVGVERVQDNLTVGQPETVEPPVDEPPAS